MQTRCGELTRRSFHQVVASPRGGGTASPPASGGGPPPSLDPHRGGGSPPPPVPQVVSVVAGGQQPRGRPELRAKEWYFGSIPRSQCDQVLNECAQDGDFLIRDSETNVGDLSVSLKAPLRNKHFRVHVEDGVFCIGQRRFSQLDDLVEHYKRAPIYTSPKGDKMFLVRPFKRP
ncbi:cytoplasmic protein NCK1 [Ixodes scapularis]